MNSHTIDDTDDEAFLQELSEFVKTLPEATAEQLAAYNLKMQQLENIHDEIRAVNKLFMPVYNISQDTETPAGNKYLDIVYTVSPFSNHA